MPKTVKTIPSSARHRFHVFAFPITNDTSEYLTAAIRKLSVQEKAIVSVVGTTVKCHRDGQDDLIVIVEYWKSGNDETETVKEKDAVL